MRKKLSDDDREALFATGPMQRKPVPLLSLSEATTCKEKSQSCLSSVCCQFGGHNASDYLTLTFPPMIPNICPKYVRMISEVYTDLPLVEQRFQVLADLATICSTLCCCVVACGTTALCWHCPNNVQTMQLIASQLFDLA